MLQAGFIRLRTQSDDRPFIPAVSEPAGDFREAAVLGEVDAAFFESVPLYFAAYGAYAAAQRLAHGLHFGYFEGAASAAMF